ncbi:RNA-binding protein [Anoxybacter fermentans]|uniref:RNA-binding protein n=1 Tax=Anoxybacter fermentans TaxID=1323375 RepID=A0A3Q9HRT7_9FIRM|nr:RNA-binding S4 domain-containing protein [Anoxybacter fermentans]AZR74305.1 RNA-binding protein [Anoxybacter fermentans]
MEEVSIKTESIKLDQFLKWARLAHTGGEAKLMVQEGIVSVNGELETRRGRTLVPGDVVEVKGQGKFRVTRA